MTPELRAAVDRARRAYDNLWSAYDVVDDRSDESLCTLHAMIQADLRALAAEHPADDDEPVTLEEVESAAEGDARLTPVQVTGQPPALWVLDAHIGIKTREQLRYLLKALGVRREI